MINLLIHGRGSTLVVKVHVSAELVPSSTGIMQSGAGAVPLS